MQYREKLLDLIVNGTQEEMHAWIKAQPPLEQVDIMREMQSLMVEIAAETDDDVTESLADADDKIANYEEAILNEQLALLKQDMAERELLPYRIYATKFQMAFLQIVRKLLR
jgi:uncharacterized protein YllA (UPF0747 family)